MKITVIGRGNAGVYTALHYKYYAPEVDVELIYDDKVPSQTVGQASFPDAPVLLFNSLMADWYKNPMKSTLKTGILYQNWGKHKKEFFHPFPLNTVALHYDTKVLQEFIIKSKYFKVKIKTIKSYDEIDSDYIFDCRGFPKDYTNYEILTNPLNSVLLSRIEEVRPSTHWTTATATPDGWCFQIPLVDRTSIGYLYNNTITPEKKALENFKKIFNRDNVFEKFSFKNYVAKEPIIDDRIILNGNKLFFFDPLEATAVTTYLNWNRYTFDWIINKVKSKEEIVNKIKSDIYQVQNFILYHYMFGSKYNTPFWKHCKKFKIKDKKFFELIKIAKSSSYHDIFKNNDLFGEERYGVHSLFNFKNMVDNIK